MGGEEETAPIPFSKSHTKRRLHVAKTIGGGGGAAAADRLIDPTKTSFRSREPIFL